MVDKVDSTRWTGDVPLRKQVPLDSVEGKKALRSFWKLAAAIVVLTVVIVIVARAWQ